MMPSCAHISSYVSDLRSTPSVLVTVRKRSMAGIAIGMAGKHNFSSVGRSTLSPSPSTPKGSPPIVVTGFICGLTK